MRTIKRLACAVPGRKRTRLVRGISVATATRSSSAALLPTNFGGEAGGLYARLWRIQQIEQELANE